MKVWHTPRCIWHVRCLCFSGGVIAFLRPLWLIFVVRVVFTFNATYNQCFSVGETVGAAMVPSLCCVPDWTYTLVSSYLLALFPILSSLCVLLYTKQHTCDTIQFGTAYMYVRECQVMITAQSCMWGGCRFKEVSVWLGVSLSLIILLCRPFFTLPRLKVVGLPTYLQPHLAHVPPMAIILHVSSP